MLVCFVGPLTLEAVDGFIYVRCAACYGRVPLMIGNKRVTVDFVRKQAGGFTVSAEFHETGTLVGATINI